MDILSIGHIVDLSRAAHPEGAAWALIDELYVDLLPRQVRLTETVVEQFFRDVTVLLADFDIQALALAVDHAGLGHGFAAQGQHNP